MPIGKRLDELIKIKNRNVNDLSKATGVKASTIYSIIRRNNTKVDLDDLQALADELSVTLDYFVSDEVKSKPMPATEAELVAAIQKESAELVNIINQLSPQKRDALLDFLRVLSKSE
jgi:transcriptional regulator with XRE-family HTH domain